MRNRRFVKVAAVVCGLSLLAAACGSDDDSSSDDTTTTTAAGSGDVGELSGAKGTTPAPETTEAVTQFQDEMQAFADDAGIDLADTYAYGPEAYDSTIIIALGAQIAGTDGSAAAAEIVGVTKDGEQCTTYAECLTLIEAGTDIDYDGISGPLDFNGNGEPLRGSYAVLTFGADNRLADDETLVTAESPESSMRRTSLAVGAPPTTFRAAVMPSSVPPVFVVAVALLPTEMRSSPSPPSIFMLLARLLT